MTVTKRTRFEVLRRDQHTCQYCGGKAPDVALQIDHVMPAALGGSDAPDNLVAACKDCNSGKTSIMPDSPLVKGLSEKAAAYALGMIDKMTKFRSKIEQFDEYVDGFNELWNGWTITSTGKKVDRPHDYELSIFRWHELGVPLRVFEMAIPKAMTTTKTMGEYPEFSYMSGIVWNMVRADEIDFSVDASSASVYTENEMDEIRADAYQQGLHVGLGNGEQREAIRHLTQDVLQHHIDRSRMEIVDEWYGSLPSGRVVIDRAA